MLLLLDYGWYSGLGLRCGRSQFALACVLDAYLHDVFWWERAFLFTCEHLSREDVIWPLTRAACQTGWRWGVLTLGP
jgi:hypothetical protein